MTDVSPVGGVGLEVTPPGGSSFFVRVTVSPFFIGRGAEAGNHLQLADRRISRKCAAIISDSDRCSLEDRGHRNGVFVNGNKIEHCVLADGDAITFGLDDSYEIVFRTLDSDASIKNMLTRIGSISSTDTSPGGLRKLNLLLEATSLLHSQLPLDSVLGTMIEHAIAITDADRGLLLEADSSGSLRVRLARDSAGQHLSPENLAPSQTALRLALERQTSVITKDLSLADQELQAAQSIVAQNLRAIVAIPLYAMPRANSTASIVLKRGRLLGALYLDSRRPAAFSKLDHQILAALAVEAASILDNARLVEQERQRQRLERTFQQYLSPEVVRRLLENPDLVKPRKSEITVMFSDVRGFTSISEKLDAQELAALLNEYLTEMTQIVFRHNGTLDKYIGDAVMAFWGAPFEEPGHATHACRAALEMIARLAEMQKKWKAEGKPVLDIGVGLSTGVASVGNMGSALRYGYTALGDTVNLSARLEGLNKEYATHILLSEATYAMVEDPSLIFRELDLIRVKGKLQPVVLYELVASSGTPEGDAPGLGERLELFAQGRACYRERRWQVAQIIFEKLLERWPEDGPARIHLNRCREYLVASPEENWDGVYIVTHK